jgi:hypothetical protein
LRRAKLGNGGRDGRKHSEAFRWSPAGKKARPVAFDQRLKASLASMRGIPRGEAETVRAEAVRLSPENTTCGRLGRERLWPAGSWCSYARIASRDLDLGSTPIRRGTLIQVVQTCGDGREREPHGRWWRPGRSSLNRTMRMPQVSPSSVGSLPKSKHLSSVRNFLRPGEGQFILPPVAVY